MAERIPLIAPKGHVLTNGKGTIGFVIYVEVGKDENEYYPITIDEYNEIMRATEEDYLNVLNETGANEPV